MVFISHERSFHSSGLIGAVIYGRPLEGFRVDMGEWPPQEVALRPDKRVLFLTKDLELIRKQVYEGLELRMEDLSVDELLDDINTDVMTPAWVCFDHDPAEIAKNAYA